MGYTTNFTREITINPPLSQREVKYLNTFFQARHDSQNDTLSPQPKNFKPYGETQEKHGAWCDLEVSKDGTMLYWNGSEKSYNMTEWVSFVVEHFIGDNPLAPQRDKNLSFFQSHTLNGVLEAQGEEEDDHWYLIVQNNHVFTCNEQEYEKLKLKENLDENLPYRQNRLNYKI